MKEVAWVYVFVTESIRCTWCFVVVLLLVSNTRYLSYDFHTETQFLFLVDVVVSFLLLQQFFFCYLILHRSGDVCASVCVAFLVPQSSLSNLFLVYRWLYFIEFVAIIHRSFLHHVCIYDTREYDKKNPMNETKKKRIAFRTITTQTGFRLFFWSISFSSFVSLVPRFNDTQISNL